MNGGQRVRIFLFYGFNFLVPIVFWIILFFMIMSSGISLGNIDEELWLLLTGTVVIYLLVNLIFVWTLENRLVHFMVGILITLFISVLPLVTSYLSNL